MEFASFVDSPFFPPKWDQADKHLGLIASAECKHFRRFFFFFYVVCDFAFLTAMEVRMGLTEWFCMASQTMSIFCFSKGKEPPWKVMLSDTYTTTMLLRKFLYHIWFPLEY